MEWPIVLQNDGGLRTVGSQGQCFYCHSKIGEEHGVECVTVSKVVEYEVRVAGKCWDDLDGEIVGTFTREDPYFWDVGNCEFHKNGSSWCAGNAVDDIKWFDTPAAKVLKEKIEQQGEDDCPCALLAFSFSKIVDEGPLRASND